ncbi:COG4315 family predicted lipoprotein [Schauerella aestuarii]|uniref:hypothetical protein n=1 Tax=Schauerella aestuarii TaxID=2511204 RepID=UPI0019290689|nr:hypothetical protein [Achromobacter aestuarii]MYZ42510.1 hypothetical protein [Achromobacter aestuarii]
MTLLEANRMKAQGSVQESSMPMRILLTLSLTAVFASMAHAESAVKMACAILVDTSGTTLYTFDRAVVGSGKSTCIGPCAVLWLPASATFDANSEVRSH